MSHKDLKSAKVEAPPSPYQAKKGKALLAPQPVERTHMVEPNNTTNSNDTNNNNNNNNNTQRSNSRRRQLPGYERTAPPPSSVLKPSVPTNRAVQAGAFRSNPFDVTPASINDYPQPPANHWNATPMPESESAPPLHSVASGYTDAETSLAPTLAVWSTTTITTTDDDDNNNPSNNKHTDDPCQKRKRLIVVASVIMLVVALAGLGTGVALAILLREGSQDVPGVDICDMETVFSLCEDDHQESFEQLPSCLLQRYRQVQELVPLFDRDFVRSEHSCHPTNLAVWSMAATAPANTTLLSMLHRYVLGTLFFETRGPSTWDRRDNWLTAESECSWYGVGCNGNQSLLEGLSLRNNGLRGPIPSQMGLLPALRE